jgi:CBS domain-containing protein
MQIRDVMTSRLETAKGETPVQELAHMMLTKRISGVPVVDDNGKLQGIVSEGDLMRRTEVGTDGQAHRSWWLKMFADPADEARDYIKTHGATAADVMSRGAISVSPEDDIGKVALLLEKHQIKRAPVLQDGRLVGIVSRSDLLRGLATHGPLNTGGDRSDREIRDALIAHLNEQTWSVPALVNITVNDAVVNLWGVYDTKDQHNALLVAARNTPGAKGVEDHLSLHPTVT